VRLDEETYLSHYGILRKSGRYPWGLGQNPLQRSKTFLDIVEQHKKVDGMTEAEIAKAYSPVDKDGNVIKKYQMTSADIRAMTSRASTEVTLNQIREAQRLRDKGMGPTAIANQMSSPDKKINESTVRSLLEPGRLERLNELQQTANMLKRQVAEKDIIDVGSKVHLDLPIGDNPDTRIGISPDKFNTALSMLKEEGYGVHTFKAPQVTTGEMTTYKVLVKPGVTQKQAWTNRDNIRLIAEKTEDGGKTWQDMGIKPPLHIDPKRVGVKYKEDGGADADGVIYVRPGVEDVSLGKARYAQVRIAVGGTHFLKGMAVYKDDLPAGIDLQFNTNKSNTGNKFDAMKPLKKDKETGEVDKTLPFGSVIKEGGQILGKDGKPKSVMNLLTEEGDWDTWTNRISSQMLSKQSPALIKSQLDFTHDRRREEFDEIKSLTNPLIKRKLLETFSDETDSAAVHLAAASMDRQATKVLLPSNHVKPHEIFAPTFHDGERVALIRFPHAGTFEIPQLTVNNRSREAKKLFGIGKGGRAPDAVAIHPKVAERLSGADFDGDHVVVIPNPRGKIESTRPLENLKGFDPQSYKVPLGPKTKKYPDGTPSITPQQKGLQMGKVTNLISDMTLRGATREELSRAVRHSMVVIDSEKHNLDYKASERHHGILELKRKYQGVNPKTGLPGGAATLITRAGAETYPVKRKDAPAGPGVKRLSVGTIDVKTGRKVYVDTGERKRVAEVDPKTGKKRYVKTDEPARFKSERLAETTNAYSLVSKGRGTIQEQYYADHSNRLKAMANEARREAVRVKLTPMSKSAKKVYSKEVEELKSAVRVAERNAPLERQAQAVARRMVAQRRSANPNMEKDELKKVRDSAIKEARLRTGAGGKKNRIGLTDRQWDAIQAGAISKEMMESILKYTDVEAIRRRATPRERPVMTDAVTARAKQMLSSGFTYAEISSSLGIPMSTLKSGVE